MAVCAYMTENVVASVELFRKLVVWIVEILEAVFPETHFFKAAKRFIVRFDPIR